MNWYKDNGKEWKKVIEAVAAEVHRMPQMIEKDTIQSIFLYEITKSDIDLVFKGGTSLSKVYCLIDRFSEDIDLSLDHKPTESEKKKIKNLIIQTGDYIGITLSDPDEVRSRHDYNKYVFEYDSLFSDIPLELMIETSFYQAVYPVGRKKVKSIIGSFCENNDLILPVSFEAADFEMAVQSPERTFIDKVFAVCDYRIQDMQDRDSRHLYDIAKLLPGIKINTALKKLVLKVRKDRMQSKNNPSAGIKYDIPEMLKEIIKSRFYEADYNNITKKLLYEDFSYEDAIKGGIEKVVGTALFD